MKKCRVCCCVFFIVLIGCNKTVCQKISDNDTVIDSFEKNITCEYHTAPKFNGVVFIQDSTINDTLQCLAGVIFTFDNIDSLKIIDIQFQNILIKQPYRKNISYNVSNNEERTIFERYERTLFPILSSCKCQVIDEKSKTDPPLRQVFVFPFFVFPVQHQ